MPMSSVYRDVRVNGRTYVFHSQYGYAERGQAKKEAARLRAQGQWAIVRKYTRDYGTYFAVYHNPYKPIPKSRKGRK